LCSKLKSSSMLGDMNGGMPFYRPAAVLTIELPSCLPKRENFVSDAVHESGNEA
jgi:hypothetical protein